MGCLYTIKINGKVRRFETLDELAKVLKKTNRSKQPIMLDLIQSSKSFKTNLTDSSLFSQVLSDLSDGASTNLKQEIQDLHKQLDSLKEEKEDYFNDIILDLEELGLISTIDDFNKGRIKPLKQSIQNELFDNIVRSLSTRRSTLETLLPSSYSHNVEVRDIINSILESKFSDINDKLSTVYQTTVGEVATNGKNLLDIFAATAATIPLHQLLNTTIPGITIQFDTSELKNKVDLDYIEQNFNILKHNGKIITVLFNRIGKNKKGNYTNIEGDLITQIVGEDTDHSADAFKNFMIPNLSSLTANIYSIIKQVGGTSLIAGTFINQEFAVILNNKMYNTESYTSFKNAYFQTKNDLFYRLFSVIAAPNYNGKYENLLSRYIKNRLNAPNKFSLTNKQTEAFYEAIGIEQSDYTIPTSSKLISQLQEYVEYNKLPSDSKIEYLISQLRGLETFNNLKEQSDRLTNHNLVMRTDKVSNGTSFDEVIHMLKNILELNSEDNALFNVDGQTIVSSIFPHLLGLDQNSILPHLESGLKEGLIKPYTLLSKHLFTESLPIRFYGIESFKDEYSYIGKYNLSKLSVKLQNFYRKYFIGNTDFNKLDKSITSDNFQFFVNDTVNKLIKLKGDLNKLGKAKYKMDIYNILDSIKVYERTLTDGNTVNYLAYVGGSKGVKTENLKDKLNYLYFYGDTEIKDFISNLVNFAFLYEDFNYGKEHITNLLTTEILDDFGIYKTLDFHLDKVNNSPDNYINMAMMLLDSFVLQNAEDNAIVPPVKTKWLSEDLQNEEQNRLTKKGTPVWEENSNGVIVVNEKTLSKETTNVKESKFIKKYKQLDNNNYVFDVYSRAKNGEFYIYTKIKSNVRDRVVKIPYEDVQMSDEAMIKVQELKTNVKDIINLIC